MSYSAGLEIKIKASKQTLAFNMFKNKTKKHIGEENWERKGVK